VFFPELLYQLPPRDLQLTWLEPLWRTEQLNLASTLISVEVVIPNDRALLLQHAYGFATPGAAQNVVELFVQVRSPSPDASLVTLESRGNPIAANLDQEIGWQGSVLVPQGWRVRAFASFNAAGAANFVALGVGGMLIPSGNFART